jgi:hypothetical protein
MQKLIPLLIFLSAIVITSSCKKNNNGAVEPKPAGINLTITRQRTVTDLKLYKYEGSKVVDSAIIAPDADKVFFIDHKWLNKNKLRIVNPDIPVDEDITVTLYLYSLSQQNNNISESLTVNFTFQGNKYNITEVNRIVKLALF